ncbi:DUF642 domain-containing protein [Streptomyces sp. NPDC006658]|uniref:DUF642 domain-containing protein n=1 Tax=Streptomyces sp. NPDC006658 TaxID=3156900 RepID=UPI0033CFDBFA
MATATTTKKKVDLVNGSFADTEISGGWRRYSKGDKIPGWTVTGGGVEVYGESTVGFDKTVRALELEGDTRDADAHGAVQQTFSTVPGATVTLTWRDAPDSGGGKPQEQSYTVRLTSGSAKQEVNYTPADGWSERSLTFTAQDKTTTLDVISLAKPESNGRLHQGAMVTGFAATQQTPLDDRLVVWQQNDTAGRPGDDKLHVFTICVRSKDWKSGVDPGEVEHTFTAPTGWVFKNYVAYAYYGTDMQVKGSQKQIDAQFSPDGKKVTFTRNPHVCTGEDDRDVLVYNILAEPSADAAPGDYDDGEACVGHAPPVKLEGIIKKA